jgi:heat shock protein HslJ
MKRILFLLLLLLSACITNRKPQLTEGHYLKLESCKWNTVELYGKALLKPDGGKSPFLDFSKGENVVHGNGGCNSMSGKYVAHDDLLTFSSIAHTERACMDNAINEQESFFFKAIGETERYKIHTRLFSGTKMQVLELYKDKTLLAVFEADSLTY